MKIAVEISGHLRTFETCAPLMRTYLLDRYDCDVFIHSWDKLDHNNATWHGAGGMPGQTTRQEVTDAIKQRVVELYRPRSITYGSEAQIKKIDGFLIQPRTGFGGFTLQAVWNTLHTEVEAHRLARKYATDNKQHYDFVIRTRPDIGLLEPFHLDPYRLFFDIFEKAVIFFPTWAYHQGFFEPAGFPPAAKNFALLSAGALDVFYLTSMAAMDSLMEVLQDFDLFYRQIPAQLSKDFEPMLSVELLFYWYAQKKGLVPQLGKINRIIKRFDAAHDSIALHKDRADNSRQHFAPKAG
ncbi:MAG: hypothetical protein ORN57_02045 [Alphaproteobacteria bacterium]|nr:hypothetical protein [Alphaproteobacteria bacterium]